MSMIRRFLGFATPTDVLRADLFMEYHALKGMGFAAVQWVPLASGDPNLRAFLIALLYARILTIHKESRRTLFLTIDELSKQNVRDEGRTGFPFPNWTLDVGFGAPTGQIWPWHLCDRAENLSKSKVYKATLRIVQSSGGMPTFRIHLKMALGQERILAPASVLIAITSYLQSTDQEGCYELAVFLWQLNEHWGSPDNVRLGREHDALVAAMAAVRNGNLQCP